MDDHEDDAARRTVIGGRHGSPTVTIALPFSKITSADAELRDAVADLAILVARLAALPPEGGATEAALVREAAEALAQRLSTDAG
jgi:hypothetical protein